MLPSAAGGPVYRLRQGIVVEIIRTGISSPPGLCIRKTSLCTDAKARDALYKMAKEWLERAVSLERAHRQNGSRLAALANHLGR
jgi:hypothetical protein